MRKFYLRLTLLLAVLYSFSALGQDFSNKGKDFWFCFPNHIPSGANGSMSLWITSDRATSGTVQMTNGTFSATFNIPANGIQAINIPHALAHISNAESGLVIQKSIRVKADPGKPAFVAYAQQYGNARSAATLLLPSNVLGKKYRAIGFTHTPVNGGGQSSRSQFQVIATKANTLINVVPFSNGFAGTPFTINLPNIGDMYQYQASNDITGTLIESIAGAGSSCSPLAVFSGNSGVTIGTSSPTCNGTSYDPLFQQNYPISTWGKNFGFIPFGDYNGNPFRVMASEDNTTVSINGAAVAILNAGQIYPNVFNSNPSLLTTATSITADKPVCVAQYAQTSVCSGSNNGDPDMVILNPIEQNIKDITIFSSTQQNINRQWLNILIKTIAAPSFTIDGAPPSTAWVPAPNVPGYSYLRHLFTPAIQGSHILRADSGFNAVCYGFQQGQFESYAYSAGTNVKDLYQQIGVSSQYGIEPAPSVCKGSPFKFKVSLPYCADSIQWDLSQLPGPPTQPPTIIYPNCAAADSSTVVNGRTIYWYSLPTTYTFNTSGAFPVTITTFAPNTDGCGSEQEIDFELNVYDPPVADFLFTTPGCLSEPVQFNDNTTTARPSYIWNWDFGDPGSGAANLSALQNPTHIFSAPGTYSVKFSTITTPGCISAEIIKTVVVPAMPTATITGGITVCANNPASVQVVFTATGGTAPYTFNYSLNGGPTLTLASPTSSNSITIPTTAAGTTRVNLLQVKNQGSMICFTDYPNSFVDVIVNANAVVNLTSAASTTNQSLCQNLAITNIVYTIGSGGTGGSVSGLPNGVTGVYNGANGQLTISGTPTDPPGTYTYTLTTTGPCTPGTATGTITINPDAAIGLSSAGGTNAQSVCLNTGITNITYSVSGGGTGANMTGLPPGVFGSFTGGVLTLAGTPTASGTFNYTVTTTGTCVQRTATGTITVDPIPTFNLTSAASTSNQTICETSSITNIVYAIGSGGTGATVMGLPTGVTGVFSAGTFTISGTPSTTGTFNYTVNVVGSCSPPSLSGTIVINPGAAMTLSSAAGTNSQELCRSATITAISYSISGGASGATITGLPAGVNGAYNAGVFTITGTPSTAGTFNYTLTTIGNCGQLSAAGSITVNELPTPNFNYSIPNCENKQITFTDISVPNSGVVNGWTWNFGDLTTSNTQNPTHSYASAGNYTVTLSVTTDKGCTSSALASKTVTVNINPRAGFIVPQVCLNDVATFTDTSSITSGNIASWQWNFGDPASGAGNTSTTQHGSHSFTATGTYTVQHIVFSNTGCSDTITHSIFINGANPLSDFTIANANALCANDSVSITNISSVNPGTVTKVEIYWDNVGAPTTFDTDNSPAFGKVYKHLYPNFQTPLTRTFTIRFRAYSGTLCVNDKLQTITVNAAPRVQFNAIPNACLDALPFQITQATEIGGVPGTGVFSGPGVTAGGVFNPASVGAGTYTIKYTYTSSAGGCVDTFSRTLTVLDSASAQFSFPAQICHNSAVNFNSTTSTIPAASGSITGWAWNFGDPASGAANVSTQQNPTHLFSNWGNYQVSLFVTTSRGCRSTIRTTPLFVNPIPRASFALPTSACLPSANITFNNNSTIPDNTQSSFTYLWNFGDPGSGALNTSTNSNPSHIYSTAGPFTVNLQVTSGAGCVDDTTIIVNNIHPQPTGLFTVDKDDICVGQTFTFTDNSDPADGTTQQWNWNMGDGNTRTTPTFTYNYAAGGVYNVSLYITNSHGCRSTTFTKTVTVNSFPIVDAGPNLFILEDGSDTLHPIVTATLPTYLWTPNQYFLSSNTIKDAVVKGVTDITYTLTVTGRGGCVASDQVFIKVLKGPEIPNIFSPNGDGIHDTWIIKYLDTYPGGTVELFNRYGQRIFHSTGYAVPWNGTVNGKPVPMGTYYYVVNPKNGRAIMSGYVDVIR